MLLILLVGSFDPCRLNVSQITYTVLMEMLNPTRSLTLVASDSNVTNSMQYCHFIGVGLSGNTHSCNSVTQSKTTKLSLHWKYRKGCQHIYL